MKIGQLWRNVDKKGIVINWEGKEDLNKSNVK
jgi:hypothetical protein